MSLIDRRLTPHWQQLESGKLSLIASLSRKPAQELRTPPQSGGWCALEVLEHLATVDRQVLKVLKRAEPGKKLTILDRLAYFGLVIAMYVPIRFRAPSSTVPRAIPASLDEVNQRWTATRHDWHEYLKQVPVEAISHNVFAHPRARGMNLQQTLFWLGTHQNRHIRQIKRLHTDS